MGGQRGEEHSTEKDQHLKSAYDELREGCPVWMELRVVTRGLPHGGDLVLYSKEDGEPQEGFRPRMLKMLCGEQSGSRVQG